MTKYIVRYSMIYGGGEYRVEACSPDAAKAQVMGMEYKDLYEQTSTIEIAVDGVIATDLPAGSCFNARCAL